MRQILVYEYLSGGGEAGSPAEAEALLPAGIAMRNAILSDLAQLPGLAASCAVCGRPGARLPAWHRPAGPGAPASDKPRAALPDEPGEALLRGEPGGPLLAAADVPFPAVAPLLAVSARPGESAEAFLRRIAGRYDHVWVVAPETGGLLSRLHEAVGPARWVGCEAAAIQVASSKRATLAALAAAGVPTPLAFEHAHAGAWVVKPDDGAGTVDTRVHSDRAAALADRQARLRAGRPVTVEPFVEGEALSVSMLVSAGRGERGVQPLSFNRQRIAVGADGALCDQGVETAALDARHDPRARRLGALARDVARSIGGLRGYVGFDVVWHRRHGPVVIEVNPRVTCAYVGLSSALGLNLAQAILALHGARLPGPPTRPTPTAAATAAAATASAARSRP